MAIIVALLTVQLLSQGTVSADGEDCRDPFVRLGDGTCVHVSPFNVSWHEAKVYCHAMTSQVMDVRSHTEQLLLEKFLISTGADQIWLSGTDTDNKGQWTWRTGVPVSYNNWEVNEPSAMPERDCMELDRRRNFQWFANKCSTRNRNRAVCKYCATTGSSLPINQQLGPNGCLECSSEGFVRDPKQNICVGLSGYPRNAIPEALIDGNPETYAETTPSTLPWVQIDLPSYRKITSVSFDLRSDGEGKLPYCSREHDIKISVLENGRKEYCGFYPGNPKCQACSGKRIYVQCKRTLVGSAIIVEMIKSGVKKCKDASQEEVCTCPKVYLGDDINVISLKELLFNYPSDE